MEQAIDETNRRRAKQVAYNTEHGLDPQPLRKRIADITDLLAREDADTEELHRRGRAATQSAARRRCPGCARRATARRTPDGRGSAGHRPGRPDPAAHRPDARRGRRAAVRAGGAAARRDLRAEEGAPRHAEPWRADRSATCASEPHDDRPSSSGLADVLLAERPRPGSGRHGRASSSSIAVDLSSRAVALGAVDREAAPGSASTSVWPRLRLLACCAGPGLGGQFFAGYLTEYSLSVDNLFVFVIIMAGSRCRESSSTGCCMVGIVIALVLRAVLHRRRRRGDRARSAGSSTCSGRSCSTPPIQLLRHGETTSRDPTRTSLIRVRPSGCCRRPPSYDGKLDCCCRARQARRHPDAAGHGRDRHHRPAVRPRLDPGDLRPHQEPYIVFTANAFALMGLRQLYFLLTACSTGWST